MNQRIKRIPPFSLAVTVAFIYFFIGIMSGIFGLIGGLSGADVTLNGPFTFSGNGPSLIIISMLYPFISALGGFIFGFLLAIIYNYSVRFTKGLVVQLEDSHLKY